MHNPRCPHCDRIFSWRETLTGIFGPRRNASAMWGLRCPRCGADLKVPNDRMLLIFAVGIFFGSQSSTLLVLHPMSQFSQWLARLWLIVGFYAIAVFVFLKLESVHESQE